MGEGEEIKSCSLPPAGKIVSSVVKEWLCGSPVAQWWDLRLCIQQLLISKERNSCGTAVSLAKSISQLDQLYDLVVQGRFLTSLQSGKSGSGRERNSRFLQTIHTIHINQGVLFPPSLPESCHKYLFSKVPLCSNIIFPRIEGIMISFLQNWITVNNFPIFCT